MRHARRLGVGLAMLAVLGWSPAAASDFVVANTGYVEQRPAVAVNTQTGQFLVAYRVQYAGTGGSLHYGVQCQLFEATGTPSGPVLLPFGSLGTIDALGGPAIAYLPAQNLFFVATAEHAADGDDRVIGRFLNGDGTNRTGPDYLFDNEPALSDPVFLDGWPGTAALHVVANTLLGEFVVTVQRSVYVDALSERRHVVSAQRISETSLLPVVQLADVGTALQTHAIAYAPVAGTTPAGGRYLVIVGHLTPTVQLLDSALAVVTPVPITWGTPDGEVIDYDVAYGRVAGQDLFLVGFTDVNNCEPGQTTCPSDPLEQYTGIWGTYVNPAITAYLPIPPPDAAFPISYQANHVASEVRGPRLAYLPDAQGFAAVWREAPSIYDAEHLLTHIRGAFVDYVPTSPLTAPLPQVGWTTMISDVTGTCAPETPDWQPCLSEQDPQYPAVAALTGLTAVVVWHQQYPPMPDDIDVMGDLFTVVPHPPDLVVSAVGEVPAGANPGQALGVGVTVANQGVTKAGASATHVFLSTDTVKSRFDVLVGGRSEPALDPGQMVSGPLAVAIPASVEPALYYLIACADALAAVPESDEANNCRASAVTIRVGPNMAPDLVVTTVNGLSPTMAPGAAFGVSDTTANQGGTAAGASVTRYYLSADTVRSAGDVLLLGQRAVPALAAGATSSGMAAVTVPAVVPGPYYVLACANDTGVAVEGNTGNNCAASAAPIGVTQTNAGVAASSGGWVFSGHSCALNASGGVVCWGNNRYGQLGDGTTTPRATPVQVEGIPSGAAAIAAGVYHTCAVTTGGEVLCWGNNSWGQLGNTSATDSPTPAQVDGLSSGVAAIAAGDFHTCALTAGGAAVCWGANFGGQLGNNSTTSSPTPVPVAGLGSGVAAIAAGHGHTCAVVTGGAVLCWGSNDYGQLGNNSTTASPTPVQAAGLTSGGVALAAGYSHTCALTTAGGVVCWGGNFNGQLGSNSTTSSPTPVQVAGLTSGVAAITGGDWHSCAVTVGGGVVCWGRNSYGQLGDGTTTDRWTPTPVVGLASGMAAIAAGESHTCAATTTGIVVCWGDSSYGRLGDGTTTTRWTPTAVFGLASDVTAIEGGAWHTCALTAVGGVACSGRNSTGQLGDGTTTDRTTPTPVVGLTNGVAAIAAGAFHTCARTASGAVLCWGVNSAGQLGNNSTTSSPTPVQVDGLTSGVAAIAAGQFHTCAVTASGAVVCWGSNSDGQLGNSLPVPQRTPAPVAGLESGVTAVAAGATHTCAVTAAGGAVCWGDNEFGQLGDGTTEPRVTPTPVVGLGSGVAAVAAGTYHTCALTTTGGVACWGHNGDGRLGAGMIGGGTTPLPVFGLGSGVVAIAAGDDHTCAVTAAGGVVCWGFNYSSQLGDGTTTSRWTPTPVAGLTSGVAAIGAGGQHTCAVVTGGAVLCWGRDAEGQLGLGTRVLSPTPVLVYGLGGAIAVGAVTPDRGPAAGGTLVAILGAAFLDGAIVVIGGAPVPSFVFSTQYILAQTGPHAPGPVDVVVLNPDGTSATLAAGFTYAGSAPVANAGPDQAVTTGSTVQLNGAGSSDVDGDPITYLWAFVSRPAGSAAALSSAVVVNPTFVADLPGSYVVQLIVNDGVLNSVPDTVTVSAGNSPSVAKPGSDFDGDGTSDVLWRGTGGDLWLWGMENAAHATDAYVGVVSDANWEIKGQGDLNGDGMADLLWRHKLDGTVYYWQMDGATPTAELYVSTVDVSYDIVGTGDFDGDGKADILWRNPIIGDLWLWRMNGAEVLEQPYVATVDPSYAIRGLGDLNGDLMTDMVWQGAAGDVWAWLMNGAVKTFQGPVGTVADASYQIEQVADFDGDGKADLLWWNAVQGDVWIWGLDGADVLWALRAGVVADTQYRIQAAGDYNGDGKADILWRHLVAGDLWVWLMDGAVKVSELPVGIVSDTGYQVVKAK